MGQSLFGKSSSISLVGKLVWDQSPSFQSPMRRKRELSCVRELVISFGSKLNNERYIIVGSLKDRRDDITEIDLFDASTKTAKEIYREKIQGYSFSDAFLVSGNRLAVVIGDNPCTPYMHKKLLLIDLKTGKVLNEADLNPDSKLVQTSIAQTINDKLIIYGGATGLYKPNNKAFIYDVNKNTFTKSDRTNIYHQVNFSKNVLMKDGNTFLVGFLYYPEDSLIEIFVP